MKKPYTVLTLNHYHRSWGMWFCHYPNTNSRHESHYRYKSNRQGFHLNLYLNHYTNHILKCHVRCPCNGYKQPDQNPYSHNKQPVLVVDTVVLTVVNVLASLGQISADQFPFAFPLFLQLVPYWLILDRYYLLTHNPQQKQKL